MNTHNYFTSSALALILLMGVVTGCKKDQMTPAPKTSINSSANEMEDLLNTTETFYDYTQAVAANPEATIDALPETLTPDEAVSYLENTFNFFFARLDYGYLKMVHDTISLELPVASDGNYNTRDVAAAFNEARAGLKSFFNGLAYEDKKLTLVDVEFNDETGVFEAYCTVGYLSIPSYPTTNVSFGDDDTWHIWDDGGYVDQNNVSHYFDYGSPTMLRHYVLANLGYYINGVNWAPINISKPNVSPTSATDNPLAAMYCHVENRTLHNTAGSCYSSTNPNHLLIPPVGMNYYRTKIPTHITHWETVTSKTMINLEVIPTTITYSSGPEHWLKIHLANQGPVVGNSQTL